MQPSSIRLVLRVPVFILSERWDLVHLKIEFVLLEFSKSHRICITYGNLRGRWRRWWWLFLILYLIVGAPLNVFDSVGGVLA